ncbi:MULTISPECIES: hypothetical protein [unclassified Curtobacterium]|uniref:hypothetical protein n=1 Tax=unclassified Curtobacterium TaxID=257496 RepID=UPI0011B85699|nr:MULTISPECIES: hypothetical protein [unclassified Curtobacterium]WIE79199.1 hypothetical protein DEJ19_001170 [Curtobacterium sp. MCSS17_016]
MRTLLYAPRTRRRSIAAATLGALALVGSLLVATPAQALVFETRVGKLPTAKVTDRIDYRWRVYANKVKSPITYRTTYGKNGGYFTGITYKSVIYTVTGYESKTKAGATTTRATRLNHSWESAVKSTTRLNGKRLQYSTQFNFKHGSKSSSQSNYSDQAQCDTSKYNNCKF